MNVKPTLMILAAGMGSRYGGLKQIEPVGPSGETIMDYSVYDALTAGFGKLLFIIRRDIEGPFRATIGSKFDGKIAVEYAYQDLNGLPAGFTLPVGRQKPWGTAHAILAGAGSVQEPFAVINADDFYGQGAFKALASHFASGSPDAAMVGYVLANTLSEFGSVARGVCQKDEAGYLADVQEMTQIRRNGGHLECLDEHGQPATLTGQEIVSLNTWGFGPGTFPLLEGEFQTFLEKHVSDLKAEFYIPTAVNNLISSGKLRVKVLHTRDSWFGVTYKEDRARVRDAVKSLVAQGVYPEKLWS